MQQGTAPPSGAPLCADGGKAASPAPITNFHKRMSRAGHYPSSAQRYDIHTSLAEPAYELRLSALSLTREAGEGLALYDPRNGL
jgi:hypothetical protein